MELFKKIDAALYKFSSAIAGILMIYLVASTLVGVFFRFVLGNPIAWIYEASIVSFSWIIFFGVAMAFKNNEHMSLEFVIANLKPLAEYILRQIINVVCLSFMIIGMYHATRIAARTWAQMYNTIPLPSGVFYLSFPLAAIPGISHIIMRMLTMKKGVYDVHDARFAEPVIHEDNQSTEVTT